MDAIPLRLTLPGKKAIIENNLIHLGKRFIDSRAKGIESKAELRTKFDTILCVLPNPFLKEPQCKDAR